MQHTCLGIAHCFLDHYYPRVLNSNANVTHVSCDVVQWLSSEYLPALRLTGVEQMAWVVPENLRARNRILDTVNLFPHLAIDLFIDVESAVTWLQQTAPVTSLLSYAAPSRSHADEFKLRGIVEAFAQRLGVAQPA